VNYNFCDQDNPRETINYISNLFEENFG